MKKYTNILLGLAGALAFTACSSVEDAPEASVAGGDVTVSVVTGDALNHRALGTVDGYTLNCVMQLLDKDGKTVGTQAVKEAAAGAASFTIKHADITAGATNAIFWAEYVPNAADGKKVYDSSDLTKISYQTTEFDLADANLMKAADAFAGKLTTIEASNTVTLTRPVSQVNFTPSNPAVVAGATKLVVTYEATSAYNVATSNCATDATGYQALTLTNATFDATATPWFSTFIIMPANLTKYEKAIDMTVTTAAGDRNFAIKAGEIPADPNYIVNVTGELSEEQDYVVDVTINGDYINEPEPEKPAEFKVGAFVKADGTATANKAEAVAIVYYAGALDGDEVSFYGSEFAGKTIKGYAVALENVSKGRLNVCSEVVAKNTLTSKENLISGIQNSNGIITTLSAYTSPLCDAVTKFSNGHKLATTVSAWYIPTTLQYQTWFELIMPVKKSATEWYNETATGTDVVKALFPFVATSADDITAEYIYDRVPGKTINYLSCEINSSNAYPKGARVQYVADGTPVEYAEFAQIDLSKTTPQQANCRLMFTIFE